MTPTYRMRPNIPRSLQGIEPALSASSVLVDWTRYLGVSILNALETPFNDAAQVPTQVLLRRGSAKKVWGRKEKK